MVSYLIDFVARLINDESFQFHTESNIKDALNVYRSEARYETLTPVKTVASGGTVTYTIFEWREYWDTDAALVDSTYASLTPATTDSRNGRWTFSSEPSRPVMITGYYYDPYSTAADLLEVRIAQLAEKSINRSNTTGAGQQSSSGQQAIENLQALVDKYRNMATSQKANQVIVSKLYRGDMW